jgi:hypothetical protein
MLSRDLVPIAQGCPLAGGVGKPLPIALDNRIRARGCERSLVPANLRASSEKSHPSRMMGQSLWDGVREVYERARSFWPKALRLDDSGIAVTKICGFVM